MLLLRVEQMHLPFLLKQQCVYSVGMHYVLAGRPGENGKASVLGGNERHGVVLIVYELSGG